MHDEFEPLIPITIRHLGQQCKRRSIGHRWCSLVGAVRYGAASLVRHLSLLDEGALLSCQRIIILNGHRSCSCAEAGYRTARGRILAPEEHRERGSKLDGRSHQPTPSAGSGSILSSPRAGDRPTKSARSET